MTATPSVISMFRLPQFVLSILQNFKKRRLVRAEQRIQKEALDIAEVAYLEIWAHHTDYAPIKSDENKSKDLYDLAVYYLLSHLFSEVTPNVSGIFGVYRAQDQMAEARSRLLSKRNMFQKLIRDPAILHIIRTYTGYSIENQLRSAMISDEERLWLQRNLEKLEKLGYSNAGYKNSRRTVRVRRRSIQDELVSRNRWRLNISASSAIGLIALLSTSFVALGYLRLNIVLFFVGAIGVAPLGVDDYVVSGINTIPWQLLSGFTTWIWVYLETSKSHIFFGKLEVEDRSALVTNLVGGLFCLAIFVWGIVYQNSFQYAVLYYPMFYLTNRISYQVAAVIFSDRLRAFVVLSFVLLSVGQTALAAGGQAHVILNDKQASSFVIKTRFGSIESADWSLVFLGASAAIVRNKKSGLVRAISKSEIVYFEKLI